MLVVVYTMSPSCTASRALCCPLPQVQPTAPQLLDSCNALSVTMPAPHVLLHMSLLHGQLQPSNALLL
jgi:hypothetical protein